MTPKDKNIKTVNVNKTNSTSISEQALRTYVNARVPVMLVSEPGMAKTATVRALAEEMGYDLVTIVPSRMEPQDISGFPTKGEYERYDEETGTHVTVPVTEYAPQKWQEFIIQRKKVILLLDEYSNAAPGTRASLLSFIQDRQFPNGDFLPEECAIVAAMNPTSSAADGYELDPATTNRMAFISWKPTWVDWVNAMKENFGKKCSKNEMKWRVDISRFIADNPGMLHQMYQPGGTTEALGVNHNNDSDLTVHESAWPSRRSWDNLAKTLGVSSGSMQVEDVIMRGIVGTKAALEFRRWLTAHSALDIAKIIEAPRDYKKWDKMKTEDVSMVLRSAIDGANADNIFNVIDIFDILFENDRASTAASYISDLSQVHHGFSHELTKEGAEKVTSTILKTLSRYSKITKGA